jgi:hypothetical protein
MKNIFFFSLIIAFSLGMVACNNDDGGSNDCGDFNFGLALQAESQTLADAATLYGMNPTTANCEAYKQAFRDYLDAARGLENCADLSGQRDEYLQAIDQAEQNLNALVC